MNKPKFGADPGCQDGLRKAIDKALVHLVDETRQYTREEFAGYDDKKLASCLLACMLMDIEALKPDKSVKIATKVLMNVEITPGAIKAAVGAMKTIHAENNAVCGLCGASSERRAA